MPDLLLEIGTEEIPARMIDAASGELARRVTDLLTRERLAQSVDTTAPSTPRRLAVIAYGLAARQPDTSEQLTGPPVKAAFKDGSPAAAAHAFAKKAGVSVDQLQRVTTPKGEYLAAQVTTKGRTASEVLAEALPREIAAIYWPKNMYWRPSRGEVKPERFVRPIRWIVALLDDEVIPLEFAGIRAGRESRGHRILGPDKVTIRKPADYAATLESAHVIVSPEQRRNMIQAAMKSAAENGENQSKRRIGERSDDALLSTVVNLTEYPSAVLGSFDPEFLTLPEEVLVTVMRDHQKYFAVENPDRALEPFFLAILNTRNDPEGLIRHGNERVLRARFNDARFFWQTDQKTPLRDRVELLKHVTFQKELGSYYEKTIRVQRLGSLVCETLRSAGTNIRAGIVHKASLLSKTDLTTELVKEFTELQGIVGGLYARVQQLHRPHEPALPDEARSAVATVIYDHYRPESMDDAVPSTREGAVLSLCDKADTIAGMFALGLIPSGSKDPFALRRQANAIIRIIAEYKLPLMIDVLFDSALQMYSDSEAEKKFKTPGKPTAGAEDYYCVVSDFFRERLDFYLRESLAIPYDVGNATLRGFAFAGDVNDVIDRARAIAEVRGSDDFTSISAAFKRMKNILRQAGEKKIAIPESSDELLGALPGKAEPSSAEADAEASLINALREMRPGFKSNRASHNYAAALREIARLRHPIDHFFDKVMVMVEDEKIRARRLALLQSIVNEFSSIADFSEIVTESK